MTTSPRLVLLDDAAAPTGDLGGALLCAIELVELADGTKKAPSEFKIFGAGTTQTTKGPVVMNARAGQHVMAKVRELGRDRLNFDYGHAQLGFAQSYEAARSAGWFSVEVRGDELWATDVEWTPTAARALSDREFRYFSPAVMLDRESNEVRELINIALTNIPATKHQKPLVASQTPPEQSMDPELKALLASLSLNTVTELAARVGALTTDNAKLVKAAGEIQAQLATATAELTGLKTAKAQQDKADFIAQLSTAGKLPPALRDWALGQEMTVLKAYADAAPVLSPGTAPTTAPTTATTTTLSDEERAVCRMMNLSEADFLATKNEKAAG
jgi:phage I-like protein